MQKEQILLVISIVEYTNIKKICGIKDECIVLMWLLIDFS